MGRSKKIRTDMGEGQIMLTVEQSAQRLGISRNLMYKLIATGEMPSKKVGRCRRVSASQLEAWASD